jgi:hypothetical protein
LPGFNWDHPLIGSGGCLNFGRDKRWPRLLPDCAVSADSGPIRAADAAVPLPTISGDINNDIPAVVARVITGGAAREPVHTAGSKVQGCSHADNGL